MSKIDKFPLSWGFRMMRDNRIVWIGEEQENSSRSEKYRIFYQSVCYFLAIFFQPRILTQLEWSCRWFSFDRMLICLESKLAKPNYKSEFYDLIYLCQLTDFIRDYDLNYISFIVGRFRYDELLPVAYICSTSTVMLPDIGYLTYHKDWFSQLDDRLIALAPDGSFVLITKDQCRPITYSYALEKFGGLAKFVSQLRQICNDKLELASYIIKRHRKRLAWRALYS